MGGLFSQPAPKIAPTTMSLPTTMPLPTMASEPSASMTDSAPPTTTPPPPIITTPPPTSPPKFLSKNGMVTNENTQVYRSAVGEELSYTSSTSIAKQISSILSDAGITKPYNYVSVFADGDFRAYNVPDGTELTTGRESWVVTYPIGILYKLPTNFAYVGGGAIRTQPIYATGPGVPNEDYTISFTSSKSIQQQIDLILNKKKITNKYNYISITGDGGFRIYDIPDGTQPEFMGDPNASVYKVNKNASNFANISRFGAGGGNGMLILLFLLVVAAVLYYLHTKGKLKIPSFEQRMAAFGKKIKSLSRRR